MLTADLHQTPIYQEVRGVGTASSPDSTASARLTGPKDLRFSNIADLEIRTQEATDHGSDTQSGAASVAVDPLPPQRSRDNAPSAAYAELILERQVKIMVPSLLSLKESLNQPEGARHMTIFRDALAKVWEIKDALPKPTTILISAIEESVRGKKWRELQDDQIQTITSTVAGLRGQGFTEKHLRDSIKTMQKNWIDLFPSADVDYEPIEHEEED